MKEKVLTKSEVLKLIEDIKTADSIMRSVDRIIPTCGTRTLLETKPKWHIHQEKDFESVCMALGCGYTIEPHTETSVILTAEYEDINIFTLDYKGGEHEEV